MTKKLAHNFTMKLSLSVAALLPLLVASSPIIRRHPLSPRQSSPWTGYPNSTVTSNTTTTTCPGYLFTNAYIAPSSLQPLSASNPDTFFPTTTTTGLTSPLDLSTQYTFSIPTNASNQTCTLEFLLPQQPIQTAPGTNYFFAGDGTFTFTPYTPSFTFSADGNHNYTVSEPITMTPGNAYTIDMGSCAALAGNEVVGVLSSADSTLVWTQDDGSHGGCPVGVWVGVS